MDGGYLSEDLRIRVIEAVEAGSSTSWCGGTVRREPPCRSAHPLDIDTRVAPHDGPHRAPIREAVTGGRDGSRARPPFCWPRGGWRRRTSPFAELQLALLKDRPVGRDRHGVAVLPDRHLSFKKNRARRWSQERPDVAARRLAWRAESQPDLDPRRGSSMRPAPRPRWPVCGAARSVANAAVPRSHMDIGRQLPSPPSTPGWPDRADAPGRADEWGRLPCHVEQVLVPTLVPGDQASWTTCRLTRSPASNRQSRTARRDPVCSCRLIRQRPLRGGKSPSEQAFAKRQGPERSEIQFAARTVETITYGMPSPRSGTLHHREPNACQLLR